MILNTDGTFDYTPVLNFFGPDSFEYTLTDGELTDTATVSIDVLPVNDAPVAEDDSFNVDEDTVLAGNVLDDNGILTGFDPLMDDIQNFIQLSESNGNTEIQINADGDEGGTFTTIAVIEGGVSKPRSLATRTAFRKP